MTKTMTDDKKNRLEQSGFRVGTIAEFLDLTPEEQAQIKNIIIRNGKPIGVCDCLGKGKDKCKGNKRWNWFSKMPIFCFF